VHAYPCRDQGGGRQPAWAKSGRTREPGEEARSNLSRTKQNENKEMSDGNRDGRQSEIEAERYELFEGPRYRFEVDRRAFIQTFGAGLVILLIAPRARVDAQESGRGGGGDRMPADVGAWLHIAEHGKVTVFTGKTEIGQNIRTSLTQAVAEELKAPVSAITLVMADTAKTPFDMGTFGSRTTPTMNLQLRKVAAAARAVLVDRAAAQWSVNREAVTVQDGRVVSGARSVPFGELMKG